MDRKWVFLLIVSLIAFLVVALSIIYRVDASDRCTYFKRTVYPDLYAKEVLIQKVNPITKQPYGDIRVGSPYGRVFNGSSTDDLPFINVYVDQRYEGC